MSLPLHARLGLGLSLSLALIAAGCGEPPAADSGPIVSEGSAAADPAAALEVEVPPASPAIDVTNISLSADQMEQIKKLPEAEQALALDQKVCPSSGENLGSMGMPIKVDLKGQTAFICCKGCLEDAETHPDTLLAKLGLAPAADAEAVPAEEAAPAPDAAPAEDTPTP